VATSSPVFSLYIESIAIIYAVITAPKTLSFTFVITPQ